jgi:hypothetical protein
MEFFADLDGRRVHKVLSFLADDGFEWIDSTGLEGAGRSRQIVGKDLMSAYLRRGFSGAAELDIASLGTSVPAKGEHAESVAQVQFWATSRFFGDDMRRLMGGKIAMRCDADKGVWSFEKVLLGRVP